MEKGAKQKELVIGHGAQLLMIMDVAPLFKVVFDQGKETSNIYRVSATRLLLGIGDPACNDRFRGLRQPVVQLKQVVAPLLVTMSKG